MRPLFIRLLKIIGVLSLLNSGALRAQDVLRLKTRTIETPRVTRPVSLVRHLILLFDARPSPALLAELAHRRIRVLAFLPDTALMVVPGGEPDLRGLPVTWAGPLEPADKISPELAREPGDVYLVMFHPDVRDEIARGILEDRGVQTLENPGLLPGHLLATGPRDRVLSLAGYDEVAYILPARTELALRRQVYGCAGALTPAGAVAEYALMGSGWPRDASGSVALRYFISSLTARIDSNIARSEIDRAFAEWARYTNVTFSTGTQSAAARSIDILFAAGAHGDAWPFTGTSVLAHTFYPAPLNAEPLAGDMHLNANADWRVGSGIDLFSVTLHEAGHALGLGHSDRPESVMYAYYRQSTGLTADDIAAIQALYGSPSSKPSLPPVTPPTNPPVLPPVIPPVTPPGSPKSPDTTSPSIAITSPALTIVSTTATSITLSGTARDNVAVTVVKWSTNTGSAGPATGTATWTAAVPLLVGTNVVTVRAYDAAGNSGWRSITVIRQ